MAKTEKAKRDSSALHAKLDRIEKAVLALTPPAPPKAAPHQLVEVLTAMADSRMIDAIKLVRGITGLGLKEAKDLVCNARAA